MTPLSRSSRLLALPLAATLTAAVLTGCGGTEDETPSDAAASQLPGDASEETSADSGAGEGDHNDADVAFATQMIPHHAQALVMTDMAIARQLDQDFIVLVDNIRAAQAPEIELMADWLQEWGEPVPETARDHVHGGHDGGEMPEMEGMMTTEQLAELEDASSAEFQELWLVLMIEHHQGAVAMAERQLEEGSYPPALDLAEEIASSQTEEIEQMQAMLAE